MSKTVYLAGPITGLSYGGSTEWRGNVIAELARHDISGVSPMRGKDYLAGRTSIDDEYDEFILSTSRAVVTRDRWDCQRSDVVLVNLLGAQRVSIGTVIELGWADSARRPIIIAMDSDNPHDHAMVRELAGFLVPTLDAAVSTAVVLLG